MQEVVRGLGVNACMCNAGMMKIHGLPQVHLPTEDAALSNLVAGSGGSTHRAGGGAGGGAIELAAGGDGKIHITTTGSILANGGNAGNENHPETAGAGSGGAIKLSGASIINEGTLSVRGGVSVRANNDWGGESSGGNGGGGRIAFHTSGELELGSYDLSGGGNVNNYVQLVTGGDLVADSIEDFSGTQGGMAGARLHQCFGSMFAILPLPRWNRRRRMEWNTALDR